MNGQVNTRTCIIITHDVIPAPPLHTGEACLPGGMRENADASLVETALREAEEEVGLDRGLTELLAVLPPFPSHRGTTTIAVTPVACLLRASPEELRLHPNTEVECLFWVPLELFVSNRNRNDHRICMEGMDFDYPCFDYVCSNGDTHTIWGLTAAICTVLASVALDRSHDNPTTMFLICSTKGATITLTEIATTSKVVQQYGGSQLTSKL